MASSSRPKKKKEKWAVLLKVGEAQLSHRAQGYTCSWLWQQQHPALCVQDTTSIVSLMHGWAANATAIQYVCIKHL
jgi:hypothetical protein